jgi:tRNA dimethylallyltransferase
LTQRHLALVGPTASGKSALAMALARHRHDLEIVTVDSMQVYRGMDIGTAKPTAADQAEVRHHLIDLVDPDDDYTVSRFQTDCTAVLAEIEQRGHRAILVGGTGLYLRSITDQLEIPGQFPEIREQLEADPDTAALFERLGALDPLAASRMEPGNRRRILRALEVTLGAGRPFSSFGPGLEQYPPAPFPVFGLDIDIHQLRDRIARRYGQQMDDGFLAEVEALRSRPGGISRTARQALGYAELLDHLDHGTPLEQALATAVTRTNQFARRQLRWFRRDPRIRWIPSDGSVEANALAVLLGSLEDSH